MLDIRILTEENIGAVCEMESAVFSDAYHADAVFSTLTAPYALCLGLFLKETLIGYILGTVIAPEAEVLRIAVSPLERRHGYGNLLLSRFLSEAQKREVQTVFLEVRKDNAPAVSLYRKTGFDVLSLRKNYYQNPTSDALVMRRVWGEKHP